MSKTHSYAGRDIPVQFDGARCIHARRRVWGFRQSSSLGSPEPG